MQANILIKKPIVGKIGGRTITLSNIKEIVIQGEMALLIVEADGGLYEVTYPVGRIVTISD